MMRIRKNIYVASCALIASIVSGCAGTYSNDITKTSSQNGTDVFKPEPESIANNYKIPEWFRDAKFGIFIHWGVYAVPAQGAWYPCHMYDKRLKAYKHHVETYGPVDKFGYKDFIPMFKAEKFNANNWVALFKKAGAKYVVPVSEHCDGFSMYDSTYNKWNSVAMGPKRDVVGEIKAACKDANLHFGLSSHRCENAWYFRHGMEEPSDVQDMSISLYGERIHEDAGGGGMTPEFGDYAGSNEKSRREWLHHTYELVDKYQPELFWFDWTVGKYPFQSTFYKFLAYYYNSALDWNSQVVVNTKFGFPNNIQVFDIERGKTDKIMKYPWQTDTSIGKKAWGYVADEDNKSPDHIVDDLVDIVSKNGNLLLNVGPRKDGTITEEQTDVLLKIGKWLDVNGEAIFCSRPWIKFGEGNGGTSGYMTDNTKSKYSAEDVRFTTRDGFLYAICLEWTDGCVLIKSLTPKNAGKIESVEMLGSKDKIEWTQGKDGLLVKFPKNKPCDYAFSFKIKSSK